MTFTPDLLDTFIADDKDVVGAAYHPRSADGEIIKYINSGEEGDGGIIPIKIEQLDDPKYNTLFEVHANGTGIMLIKTEVFKKIPRPWFMFEYNQVGQCSLGEDWYFCREAKRAGFKIYTDPRIKVGHLGSIIY
jgi:GT2 family glycosyltransferase